MLQFKEEPTHNDNCASGKPGYSSLVDANTAILRSWHSGGSDSPKTLSPYKCDYCGYLHLTKQDLKRVTKP